ncbi:2544_t:CDS:1 [Funneliformis geosporum]|uniref:ribonuclease III n=1 Tax=Funneliformis geosporum TaxID=1117311 RepID=A0A9W4X0F0_9GLOM|nr:2544_t:CDS:1 [Funneliformis geosporum]CAI2177180.1 16754_t:CDS:1 [Funneliformis geosporum]
MSGNHNEKLEFLGDSIISFVVADYLYDRCKDYKEGELTMLRAKLVCKQTLAEFAVKLRLDVKLRLGVGALSSNARNNEKVLEDAFEAYVGAIFLDTRKNYQEVMEFMKPLIEPKVEQLLKEGLSSHSNPQKQNIASPIIGPRDLSFPNLPHEDPINTLQTWSQRRSFGLPLYKEVSVKGQDHSPQFTFEVVINGKPYAQGTARNKKDAKKQAAIKALNDIRGDGKSDVKPDVKPDVNSEIHYKILNNNFRSMNLGV